MMAVCRVLCGVVIATFLVSESWDRHPKVVVSLTVAREVASVSSTFRIDGPGERLESVDSRLDGLDLLGEQ